MFTTKYRKELNRLVKATHITPEVITDYQNKMDMMHVVNSQLHNNGNTLVNYSEGNKKVLTFRFMGKQYTTNFNRNKEYCFDHKWEVADELSSIPQRLYAIVTGRVKQLPPSYKAILTGLTK